MILKSVTSQIWINMKYERTVNMNLKMLITNLILKVQIRNIITTNVREKGQ